jgi:hyperosmotically inducible protein
MCGRVPTRRPPTGIVASPCTEARSDNMNKENTMRVAASIFGLTLAAASLASTGAWANQAQTDQTSQNAPANTDNTRVNARDKDGASVTPQNQSNAAADRKLLAAVRRAIVKDKSLSTTAHNVKIMTANGAVTLRGPVKTDDEKSRIGTLVKQLDGVTNVDNELDVKAN